MIIYFHKPINVAKRRKYRGIFEVLSPKNNDMFEKYTKNFSFDVDTIKIGFN